MKNKSLWRRLQYRSAKFGAWMYKATYLFYAAVGNFVLTHFIIKNRER